MQGKLPDMEKLAARLVEGDRRALAQAITLIESTRADHRAVADDLLAHLLPHTGRAVRLGISGVPGVGKSTFIEAFGLHLIEQGRRVAVLRSEERRVGKEGGCGGGTVEEQVERERCVR